MTDSEKALDYLEQQIPSLSAAAVDVAVLAGARRRAEGARQR